MLCWGVRGNREGVKFGEGLSEILTEGHRTGMKRYPGLEPAGLQSFQGRADSGVFHIIGISERR